MPPGTHDPAAARPHPARAWRTDTTQNVPNEDRLDARAAYGDLIAANRNYTACHQIYVRKLRLPRPSLSCTRKVKQPKAEKQELLQRGGE